MKPELLAPAGSLKSMQAAINAGADAVYAGLDRFSARAYADNMTSEEYIFGLRCAHLHDVSVYLTLNTLINTSEYGDVYDSIRPLYESGLDGIIIQDMGLIPLLKECFPELRIHASTQMSIMNTYGAGILKDLGVSRIVPARELTLEEIRRIKQQTGLEIECFIHGAMCYSYSGQCLMSSIIGGRSGNRGRCAGTCRLPFDVIYNGEYLDKERPHGCAYPLSMKDMCTVDILPDLIDAGIDSFKIEGRMKSPEYVAGVTHLYRKYIDLYTEHGRDSFRIGKDDRDKLRSLYIRTDISAGYYYGKKGLDLITPDSPGYNGSDDDYIGHLTQEYVHQCSDLPAHIYAYIHPGEPVVVTADCDDAYATVTGPSAEPAKKAPLTASATEERLSKTGDSGFSASSVDIDIADSAFVPVKTLNELRRQAFNELADAVIASKGYTPARRANEYKNDNGLIPGCNEKGGTHATDTAKQIDPIPLDVSVSTYEQLWAVLDLAEKLPIRRVYIDYSVLALREADTLRLSYTDMEVYMSMPAVLRADILREGEKPINYEMTDTDVMLQATVDRHGFIEGILVHTADELGYAMKYFPDKKIVTDTRIYVHNPAAAGLLANYGQIEGCTLPYELNGHDMYELVNSLHKDAETSEHTPDLTCVVYGYIPMMITAGCVKKTYGRCDHRHEYDRSLILRDRKGLDFPVVSDCNICTNIIYNERPLSLYRQLDDIAAHVGCYGKMRFRIDLTIEDKNSTISTIRAFACRDEVADLFVKELPSTTGHFRRGAL